MPDVLPSRRTAPTVSVASGGGLLRDVLRRGRLPRHAAPCLNDASGSLLLRDVLRRGRLPRRAAPPLLVATMP